MANKGDYLYVGPWGPGGGDAASRMFTQTENLANRSQVAGYTSYKQNLASYERLKAGRDTDTGRSSAVAAASGAVGTQAAQRQRERFGSGAAGYAARLTAPTAPENVAPKYEYVDPREAFGLYRAKNNELTRYGPTGQVSYAAQTGVAGYNAAFNASKASGGTPGQTGQGTNSYFFQQLNLGLAGDAERLKDFKILTQLGQAAWSPEQFDKIKSTYDARYAKDVQQFQELSALSAQTGSGDPDFDKYQKERADYNLGGKANSDAAAAAGGERGSRDVGIGQGIDNTSPGLSFIKRDDTAWI